MPGECGRQMAAACHCPAPCPRTGPRSAADAQARTIQTPHPGCIAAVGGNGERRSGFALHSTRPASVIMVPTASLIEDARGFLSAYADYYAIAFDRSWQMPWLRQNGSQRIMCLTPQKP